jgi:hypothetical protein
MLNGVDGRQVLMASLQNGKKHFSVELSKQQAAAAAASKQDKTALMAKFSCFVPYQ